LSAPMDPGWRTMFTGLDLRGWRTNAAIVGRWRAEGGRLHLRQEMPSEEGTLWTEKAFSDAEFVIDCRPAKAEAGKETSVPAVQLRGLEVKLAGAEAGKYQRFTVTAKDRQITVKRNEQEAQRLPLLEDAPSRGAFGLRDSGVAVEFMNLYVRDL
jgi:hypothetical protein